jgi:hypothetical protein
MGKTRSFGRGNLVNQSQIGDWLSKIKLSHLGRDFSVAVQFQHSHPVPAGSFANVGVKGPLHDMLPAALDLTFP